MHETWGEFESVERKNEGNRNWVGLDGLFHIREHKEA